MALNYNKDLKMYYSIKEVASMFGVAESLLRFWEKEFTIIAPKKLAGNVRQYRKEDIENIKLIYHLVKERGMTLNGARMRLEENKKKVVTQVEIVEKLKKIKEELQSMRQALDYIN